MTCDWARFAINRSSGVHNVTRIDQIKSLGMVALIALVDFHLPFSALRCARRASR
jgi:hypothetical protein